MMATDLQVAYGICYLIIFIPKLTMFIVSIECYIGGVMILKYHMEILHNLIMKIHKKNKFRTSEKLTMLNHELKLCDYLDALSQMHSKLFKIYKTFCSMYQFQLLLLFLSNYFSLMIDMFYVFNITYYAYNNLKSTKGFRLRFIAIVAIVIRTLDTFFVLKGSSYTNQSETKNLKLLTSMDVNGRDERLKETVSINEVKMSDII